MVKLLAALTILIITGCSNSPNMAPVVDAHWQPYRINQQTHVVQRGETLYAIAFRYDLDYRQLAGLNRLRSPYSLRVGQILHLKNIIPAHRRPVYAKPRFKTVRKIKDMKFSPAIRREHWLWPVKGRVINPFIPHKGKKGIDIAGRKGEKVKAATNGVVAYAGNGLLGYGNLIIIKHDNQFLTAYGNNSKNLVREGQRVKAGQEIADIGVIDRSYWGVHFEIRKAGQPINPMQFLP